MSTSSRDAALMGLQRNHSGGRPHHHHYLFPLCSPCRYDGTTPNLAYAYQIGVNRTNPTLCHSTRPHTRTPLTPCRRRRLNTQSSSLILAPALLPARLSHCLLAPPVDTPPAGPYDAAHHPSCHARKLIILAQEREVRVKCDEEPSQVPHGRDSDLTVVLNSTVYSHHVATKSPMLLYCLVPPGPHLDPWRVDLVQSC